MINEIKFSDEIIKQYENLRLFAIDKQPIQYHWDYMYIVHKGMMSWLIEKTVNKKENNHSIQMNQRNDLHFQYSSQIMGTIVDILIKKIRTRNKWKY